MMHYNIKVHGVVQGVFYRANTQKKALDLGVNGWVRNEDDGSVYIEAEGEEEQLESFVSWCKSGPERARVETVEVKKTGELKKFESFEIK